ncbi:MAG: hypothetical protein ACLTYN_02250 [Dysosmobacter welbionis]
MNDIELLQYVHETAEMGIEGLNSLDGQVRDDSLRRVLSQQGAEYRQIADQAERLLRSLGESPGTQAFWPRCPQRSCPLSKRWQTPLHPTSRRWSFRETPWGPPKVPGIWGTTPVETVRSEISRSCCTPRKPTPPR